MQDMALSTGKKLNKIHTQLDALTKQLVGAFFKLYCRIVESMLI